MSFVSQTAACCGSGRRGSGSGRTSISDHPSSSCNSSRRASIGTEKSPRNQHCCCREHSPAIRRGSLSRAGSLESPTHVIVEHYHQPQLQRVVENFVQNENQTISSGNHASAAIAAA